MKTFMFAAMKMLVYNIMVIKGSFQKNTSSFVIHLHIVCVLFSSMQQDVLSRKRNRLVKKSKTAKASTSSQRLEAELSFLNEQATGK